MDAVKVVRKVQLIRLMVGLLVIGILFTVLGVIFMQQPKTECAETTGTITDIQIVEDPFPGDDMDETEYHVFVTYEVDGETYEDVEYGAYDSGMKVGKEVTIQYDVNDPSQIVAPGGGFIPYVITGIGVVCIIVGAVLIIRSITRKREEKALQG